MAKVESYLKTTKETTNGTQYHDIIFTSNGEPYYMDMEVNTATYAAWQRVALNVVDDNEGTKSGFFGMSTTYPDCFVGNHYPGHLVDNGMLKWSDVLNKGGNYPDTLFVGWTGCNWWPGDYPQLFFIDGSFYGNVMLPCGCAKIDLLLEYI